MARLNVQNERVQRLINQHVVPLFLVYGSIAALTKALNDTLQSAALDGTGLFRMGAASRPLLVTSATSIKSSCMISPSHRTSRQPTRLM